MDIIELRKDIDAVDEKLISLFSERLDIVADIAKFKAENSLPVYDAAREKEKFDTISAMLPDEKKAYVEELYSLIFRLSRNYQLKLIDREVHDA